MKVTEQIQLKKNGEMSQLCHISKSLYNKANYIIRQNFFNNNYWTRYYDVNNLLKNSSNYRSLPIHTSQQILILLDKNWKSFFNSMKDWKEHPEKYRERPRPPKYKKKNGEFMLIFDNYQCKIKDNYLYFPKKSNIPPVKTRIKGNLHQVRILPRGEIYFTEIIYEKNPINLELNKNRILGVDLGLNNLVTIVNNAGLAPFIIKGGVVKSTNQFYNKRMAGLRSMKDQQKYDFETKRLKKLTIKRNNKIKDYFHKVSKEIINYCIKNDFGTIIIGHNNCWKQEINLGKRNNQNFIQIPFSKLVQKIQYKAELLGIVTQIINEDHTSKCSFFDNEPIEHRTKYIGKRISRGLFKSKKGIIINADVNGAYNIIRKAVPEALKVDEIEGAVGHPYSILITE